MPAQGRIHGGDLHENDCLFNDRRRLNGCDSIRCFRQCLTDLEQEDSG